MGCSGVAASLSPHAMRASSLKVPKIVPASMIRIVASATRPFASVARTAKVEPVGASAGTVTVPAASIVAPSADHSMAHASGTRSKLQPIP